MRDHGVRDIKVSSPFPTRMREKRVRAAMQPRARNAGLTVSANRAAATLRATALGSLARVRPGFLVLLLGVELRPRRRRRRPALRYVREVLLSRFERFYRRSPFAPLVPVHTCIYAAPPSYTRERPSPTYEQTAFARMHVSFYLAAAFNSRR